MANFQETSHWPTFLADFSRRNHGRRARFERFDWDGVEEEAQEAHLESITVDFDGADAPRVIVTRLDTSTAQPQTVVTVIPNVKWINPRYDTDNSEESLEIADAQRTLTLLRMESLVDGAS